MKTETIQTILQSGMIAILRGYTDEQIKRIAEALIVGGIFHIELTYRPDGDWSETARAIAMLHDTFGSALSVGAGTVLYPEQVRMTREAGGAYIISPNTKAEIIALTNALDMVSIPGALTPTECVDAHDAGADFVKLFPASALGPSYLSALAAPLAHIRFLAVGGVQPEHVPAYVKAGACGFGIAGKLNFKAAVDCGDYRIVTEGARAYCAAFAAAKG